MAWRGGALVHVGPVAACGRVCLEEVSVLIVDAVELSPPPALGPAGPAHTCAWLLVLILLKSFLSLTHKTLLRVIRFLWRRSWNNPSLFGFFTGIRQGFRLEPQCESMGQSHV